MRKKNLKNNEKWHKRPEEEDKREQKTKCNNMQKYENNGDNNFMVFINSNTYNNTKNCGGILIATDFVLTAAHCVDGAETVEMLIGITDLKSSINDKARFKSKKIIIHEHYNVKIKENDIALIQLSRPVELNKSTGLAQLLKKLRYLKDGSTLKVMGWGAPNPETGANNILETKEVTLDLNFQYNIYKNKDSIIFTDGKNGPYKGDSGGPLLDHNFVIGVISGELHNKKSYSSVPFFYVWIYNHLIESEDPGVLNAIGDLVP